MIVFNLLYMFSTRLYSIFKHLILNTSIPNLFNFDICVLLSFYSNLYNFLVLTLLYKLFLIKFWFYRIQFGINVFFICVFYMYFIHIIKNI